jgi:methylisocitrate lyase
VTEAAGFDVTYLGGLNTEAAVLGVPDLGLITLTELATHARHIAKTIDIPLVVDADTGFGTVLNIVRTVGEFEDAGIAGIHIEDQAEPKRCPYVAGRRVQPREAAVRRIKAACDARTDPDFVIIARCDGDAVSVDELIERSRLYLEAGADLVMPMLIAVDGRPFTDLPLDERREVHVRVCREIDGPVACPQLPEGLSLGDVRAAGYAFLQLGLHALVVSIEAQFAFWDEWRRTGGVDSYFGQHPPRICETPSTPRAVAVMDFLGLDRWLEIEKTYGLTDELTAGAAGD